jgi:hypothetical protein
MGAERHGAYITLATDGDGADALVRAPVAALASKLGLVNEFFAGAGHPSRAVAFLRRVDVMEGQQSDERLSNAEAIVHVAAEDAEIVSTFCGELERLSGDRAMVKSLRGAVQPMQYTGGAMHQFAYAGQRAQEPGASMPNAFLLPLKKLPEWWAKDWMERHTYFLPRYDPDGRMISEGHALAASAGIPALMRRTYRCGDASFRLEADATGSGYDFLTYFECADADVATFQAVCAALRDLRRNPEWRFVREGPTWRGRRVESWSALWSA